MCLRELSGHINFRPLDKPHPATPNSSAKTSFPQQKLSSNLARDAASVARADDSAALCLDPTAGLGPLARTKGPCLCAENQRPELQRPSDPSAVGDNRHPVEVLSMREDRGISTSL